MALPATKHIDPVIGVDVHQVIVPPAPPTAPTPIPHPHVGMIFDPREYVNAAKAVLGCMAMSFVTARACELAEANPALAAKAMAVAGQVGGVMANAMANPLVATALAASEKKDALMGALGANIGSGGGSGRPVMINGMMRATVGTYTHHLPGLHFPLGASFGEPDINPSRDAESYMGSKTVMANSDPLSFAALPALSCWMTGLQPSDHDKAHTTRSYTSLPTATMLPIPMGRPVLVGGMPVLNLLALTKSLWKAFRGSALAKKLADKMGLESGFLRCTVLDAEPVHSITGEVVVEQQDFHLPGRLPFSWVRYYRGHYVERSSLGHAWQTLADCRLEIVRHGLLIGVVARFPDRATAFDYFPVLEGDEGRVDDGHYGDSLWRQGDTLLLQTKPGVIYHFHLPPGWPQKLEKLPDCDEAFLAGNWRPSVHDSLTLYLQRFNDRNQNAWHCRYDDQNRLRAFTEYCGDEATGREIRLEYDGEFSWAIGSLTLWISGKATRTLARYRYDQRGDMVAVEDAAGEPYAFGYEDEHRMVRHTNRNRLSFYYAWQRHDDGVIRVVHAWGDGGLFDYRFDWHPEGGETLITDSLGHTTRLQYNERQFPLSRTNALGETFSYRYDSSGRTSQQTDPQGNVTAWQYDAQGNEISQTWPDQSKTTVAYDAQSHPICVTDPTGAKWLQEFDERGNLTQQQTPTGETTRYGYDNRGLLLKVERSGGGVTHLGYDQYGFLNTLTDPAGNRVTFEHDCYGNLICRTDADGAVTHYRYDICNHLIHAQLPGGKTLDCSYDPEGNLLRYHDDHRRVTQFSYFGQGRLKKRIEPDGSTVRYRYDTEEQLIGVENQLGERWGLKRDAAGRLTEEVDYHGRVRRYDYNAAGHLTKTCDPLGHMLAITCDRMGRIVSKTLLGDEQASNAERFRYDAAGRLTEAVNAAATVKRRYGADGLLAEEWQKQQGVEALLEYDYRDGLLHHQRQRIYRENGRELLSSQHQTFGYDVAGRVSTLAVDDNQPLSFSYDEQHRLSELTLSSTLSQHFSYNQRGLLVRNQALVRGETAGQTEYFYDEHDNLVQRRDSLTGTDSYRYDPLGQIIEHTNPEGLLKRFSYDSLGNRFRAVRQNEQEQVWQHDGGVEWRLDGAGQLRVRREGNNEQRLGWDCHGRLRALATKVGRWRYDYDALGRRVCKRQYDAAGATEQRTTWFVWDGDRLVQEVSHWCAEPKVDTQPRTVLTAGEPGWTAQSYVYHPGTFEPLLMQTYQAEVNATPLRMAGERIVDAHEEQKARLKADNLCFYQNDPNGMPLRLRTGSGQVVWSAHYEVFGKTTVSSEMGIWQPIRFQGQYFDAESGLHYNRYRYYDPLCGVFVSSDPIGLVGGINLYAYAPNMLEWSDPFGLTSWSQKLRNAGKAQPSGLTNAHGHHIVFKGKFEGDSRKPFVDASKSILVKYGIDPVNDIHNLMWASNIEGVHTTENAKKVALELIRADKEFSAEIKSGEICKTCAKRKMESRIQSIGRSVFGGY